MSKELLYHLNGNKNGILKEYLDSIKEPLNIAWYPSAGEDFRPMFYLSHKYSEINPASTLETIFPNFFIYSDYFPWPPFSSLTTPTIYNDGRTKVEWLDAEELPRLDLPLDSDIVNFPYQNLATGKVLFLKIKITSNRLGEFQYPLIYAFVENESFCSKILLPMNCRISHIIHVRYGGIGKSSGVWVLNVLKRLNCKIFITDGHYYLESGDKAAYEKYKNLKGKRPEMDVIRTIRSEQWSDHGDVTWNIVK